MQIGRGYKTDITAGDRKSIFCEGGNNSVDVIFYKTILGADANKFEFKPIGSSNTLLCFAETNLINNGFCLIDKDFRTTEESIKLEEKYDIKFLKVHEVENFLLNIKYLKQLEYIRKNVNIEEKIEEIIQNKRVRFLADFFQFKINNHLDKFPRISKLSNSELPSEDNLIDLLFSKLDSNYNEVEIKIKEIKEVYISNWKEEFNNLTIENLPSKEIFKELKNKIFLNPPKESDIAKDIALLMLKDDYIPEDLRDILATN
jgi:hypothetical protein